MKMPHQIHWVVSALMLVATFPSKGGENPVPFGARAALTQAVNHARQIGLALFEFEIAYGSFPSEETREDLVDNTATKLAFDGKTSNAMFRQLIAMEVIGSEAVFFARIPGVAKGDNDIKPGKALAKGENAFAYIAGLSAAGNPARPLVVCPLIPGTTKFDPKPFGGKAVILRIDNSVQALQIDEDGRVLVDGVELLSKDHPVWKGKAPDIRYPDLPQAE